MGTPPILMRSKQNGDLSSLSDQTGKHLGVNGDHVAGIEYDPQKVCELLKLGERVHSLIVAVSQLIARQETA